MISNVPADHAGLWSRGLYLEQRGSYSQARECYSAIARDLPEDLPTPLALLERLAETSAALGDLTCAEAFLLEGSDWAARAGEWGGPLRLRAKLASLFIEHAALEKAEFVLCGLMVEGSELGPPSAGRANEIVRRLEQCVRRAPAQAAGLQAAALACGRFWASLGQFTAGLRAIELAREIAEKLSPQLGVAADDIVVLIAELRLDSGVSATDAPSFTANSPELDERGVRRRLLRARGEMIRGHFGEALATLAATHRHSGNNPSLHARVALAYASLLGNVNQLGAAARVLEQSGALFDEEPSRWRSVLVLALERLKLKSQEAARGTALAFSLEQIYDEAAPEPEGPRPENEPCGDYRRFERLLDELNERCQLVFIALATGNLAHSGVRDLWPTVDRSDSTLAKARATYVLGLQAYHRDELGAARRWLESSAELAERHQYRHQLWQSLTILSWVALRERQPEAHEDVARRAKALLEAISSELEPADRVRFLLNKWSSHDEYISGRAHQVAARPASALPWIGGWLTRRRHSRAAEALHHEVALMAGHESDHGMMGRPPPLHGLHSTHRVEAWVNRQLSARTVFDRSRSFIRPRLDAKTAIAHYCVLPDRILLFLIIRRRAKMVTLPVHRVDLDEAIAETQRAIELQSRGAFPPLAVRAKLARLGELLGADALARDLPTEIDRLIIVPQESLVNVPYAALDANGASLCQRFSVSTLPNCSWLGRSKRLVLAPHRALCIGVERYAGYLDLPDLPGAVREARAIATRLGLRAPTTLLTEHEATAGAVARAMSEVGLVHIACHGMARIDSPHDSCLVLSEDRDTPHANREAGARELSIARLQAMDLRRLDLAVISSCRAASVVVLPGQEWISLPAAFQRAGTRHVIAPLWEVDDQFANRFMRELHEELTTSDPGNALRDVQRRWAGSRDRQLAMPFHWAGYSHYTTE
jgi:CHAT domain-containing protein